MLTKPWLSLFFCVTFNVFAFKQSNITVSGEYHSIHQSPNAKSLK